MLAKLLFKIAEYPLQYIFKANIIMKFWLKKKYDLLKQQAIAK